MVEQIEKGEIASLQTKGMLKEWLEPMHENNVDTIVLGCTHYPLIGDVIKQIMTYDITLIETGEAISQHLVALGREINHINEGELEIHLYRTGDIQTHMINKLLSHNYEMIKVTL